MTNHNVQNNANNVKGGKRFAPALIAAIVTLSCAAAMLTGCGTDAATSSAPAANTSAVSESAAAETTEAEISSENTDKTDDTKAEQAAEPAAEDASVNADTNTDTAAEETGNASDPDHIGVDQATAVSNVRELVGSGAEIISCTKGYAPDTGFSCWVIEVSPVTNGTGPDTVTYYSGYQFCYPYDTEASETADGAQNPMMNYIGTYTNGRAMMTVACIGNDQASVRISWGSSAFETSIWEMSGSVTTCNEGVSFSYDNCVKQSFQYSEDGELLSDDIEYENGSGCIDFLSADNNAYWYDSVENAGAGYSFWYCS